MSISYPTTNSRRRALIRSKRRFFYFSFTVSGSERTFTFRVSLNTLPTLATLVRDEHLLRSPKKNLKMASILYVIIIDFISGKFQLKG